MFLAIGFCDRRTTMRRSHLSVALLLGLCLAMFVGCAQQTGATVSQAAVPPLKPGLARVWFFRPALTPQFGAVTAFSPMIYVDGGPVRAIPPGTTFFRDFAPGTYRFTVEPYGLPTPQAVTVQLASGAQDYLQVDWVASWTQGYPPASWDFKPNTFAILAMAPQVAQAYLPTLAYLGEQ
jgi:hypothetical protein